MFRSSALALSTTALLAASGSKAVIDQFAIKRQDMVREQIKARGIRDSELLRVLGATPRHLFVPEWIRGMAYSDSALPIGYEATISQPYIVAFMTQLVAPQKHHRVLEVGTGSGYQAAVLSQLTMHVYSIEVVPALAEAARRRLAELGYDNVTVRTGDGNQGWPEKAPFDGIVVTAASEQIAETLISQLGRGGRLVAPVGRNREQDLILVERRADGTLRRTVIAPVMFVPMKTPGH